ncbi:MAG: hydroxyisourate hydrolase [Acidimicrobiia bacterium]
MSTLSTHVLDTSTGQPAGNMTVRLARWSSDAWLKLSERATNSDGRVSDFESLQEGRYRLSFETGDYGNSFYPFVAVVFEVDGVRDHYHIPLLLSPYGYTTYRGS